MNGILFCATHKKTHVLYRLALPTPRRLAGRTRMACYRPHCTLPTFDRQRIAICARSDDGGEKCVGGSQVRAKPTFLDGNVVCAEEEAKKGQRAQRFLGPYTEIREGCSFFLYCPRRTNC